MAKKISNMNWNIYARMYKCIQIFLNLDYNNLKIHFRPFYEINCQIGYGNATKMACPKK